MNGCGATTVVDCDGRSIGFRPIRCEDEPFLRALYASTRADEMALTDWAEEEQEAFLAMQFDAQHAYYQQQFPRAQFSLIVEGGAAIGRLYVDHRPDEIRLIDIALLPPWRGAGVGSAILTAVLEQASDKRKLVRIHVERFNPALSLYTRLGFHVVENRGPYHLMEWSPPGER